jgi:effector-binding domain-containing protein
MILHMGVRTTDATRVACRPLAPGEDEASAIIELLGTLSRRGGFHHRMYDHSIIVYYDPPGKSNIRRELLIPVSHEVGGVETKVFPSVRVAFLVFKHTDNSLEGYYDQLRSYMEQSGLEASGDIYSIEIMYIPEDLDMQDYTMEIMIPLAS